MNTQLISCAMLSVALLAGATAGDSCASNDETDAVFVGGEFHTANPRQP